MYPTADSLTYMPTTLRSTPPPSGISKQGIGNGWVMVADFQQCFMAGIIHL